MSPPAESFAKESGTPLKSQSPRPGLASALDRRLRGQRRPARRCGVSSPDSLVAPARERGRRSVGAGGQTRTADLLITNQLLYQLSYISNPSAVYYTGFS